MEDIYSLIPYTLLLVLFLLFSAFFSGSETAFFSLNSLEREKLKSIKGKWNKKFITHFFNSPDRLLATILTGNMIVNVFATDFFASTVSELICESLPQIDPELFSIVVMIPLILLFGEMIPKNISVRHPLAFSRFSVMPLHLFYMLFFPITGVLNIIRHKILKRWPAAKNEDENLKDALISFALKVGHRRGLIKEYEMDILDSYLAFRNKKACDVMVPRTEISGIDISTTTGELLKIVSNKNNGFTSGLYIYIYKGDYDHLIGYIDIRDLLPIKYGSTDIPMLSQIVKPFLKIPDSKDLSDLARELREDDVALVIDEYGGTAGIVTFQDIITDLLDYFYTSERDSIRETGSGEYVLPGSLEINVVEDFFAVEFSTDSRTVSGMIMEHLGEIPARGVTIEISGIFFTVIKPGKTKIIEIKAAKGNKG